MSGTLIAQQVKVTQLMTRDITECSGKEGVMLEVVYPPGGSDPVHQHHAYAFVYIIEGTVVMQLKGGKPVTLGPGQIFYEGPNDVHILGHNASKTKPAKFLAFFIKDKGAPILTLVK